MMAPPRAMAPPHPVEGIKATTADRHSRSVMGIVFSFVVVTYHLRHLPGEVIVGLAQISHLVLGSVQMLLDN